MSEPWSAARLQAAYEESLARRGLSEATLNAAKYARREGRLQKWLEGRHDRASIEAALAKEASRAGR